MPQSATANQPIIIIRKKAAHHAPHHGGAWKVAYADFVTAMMALFIVLWLMASSDQVKNSIAAYFLDPKGLKHEVGSGGLNGSCKSMYLSLNEMQNLKMKLEQAFRSLPATANRVLPGPFLRFDNCSGDDLRFRLMSATRIAIRA